MSKKLTEQQKSEIKKHELKTRNLVTIYLDDMPLRLLENDTLASFIHNGETYRGNGKTR